ncbi:MULTISPECIES: hypothetical protein [unclassified Sphingomonas]|uniref:hypothetical protein n=1 Tax=unclassified Sphingomonas TaxID=196159 RepID=UPI002150EC48|nr:MULTISPECIES: hypothetical protein [unclassified Sphingomonas]MCR5870596.1 hypothetical protein [Sphingomonas sp. J344]UUY01059.1 hypothetical protein LRS08_08450 [Sphingomonas sp. J315]
MRAALRLIALALAVAALPVRGEDRPHAVTGAEMRAEARALAAGDPRLLAEVEAADAEAERGVLGAGPSSIRQTVPAGATWSLPITRSADAAATIAVRRIGASPVALTILDSAGRQLCTDSSTGALLTCRIPAGGGPLVARVANRGAAATDVLLVMN